MPLIIGKGRTGKKIGESESQKGKPKRKREKKAKASTSTSPRTPPTHPPKLAL